MNKFKAKSSKRPEQTIQDAIVKRLRNEGWFVIKTHGNAFQCGLPDLYATHSLYGARWIEVKTPNGRFTPAQFDTFPKLSANGSPVWVLQSADEVTKIKGPENWMFFIKGLLS